MNWLRNKLNKSKSTSSITSSSSSTTSTMDTTSSSSKNKVRVSTYSTNELYVFGNAQCANFSSIDIPNTVFNGIPNRINTSFLEEPNEYIIDICCTSSGTILISSTGSVYGTGKLGSIPCVQQQFADKGRYRFTKHGFTGKRFLRIQGNTSYVMLFADDDKAYAIGSNDYGSIGNNRSKVLLDELTEVAPFLSDGEFPVLAACCFSSSLICTNRNNVYAMGQVYF
jgi:hypothetical protein